MNELYADGGVIKENPSPTGGTWAYRLLSDGVVVCERAGVITPRQARMATVSNNLTEMCAVIAGLSAVPDDWQGTVLSDSQVTLGRVFMSWKWNNIPDWLHERYQQTVKRLIHWQNLQWVLLDGHPTAAQIAAGAGKRGHPVSIHNKWCDEACGKQAAEYLKAHAPVQEAA